MYIDKEEMEIIETARKYGLVPGTRKCEIFMLFDKGFSRREVRFLMEKYLEVNIQETRTTLSNNIQRYYFDWKNAQPAIDKGKQKSS